MFCEVQGLAVWNYLSLAFGSARARLAKVLSRLFLGARARAPTRTWSDQTTQRKACGSFSANTNDKRQKTRLLAFVPPPHRFLSFFLFFFLSPFLSFSFFLFLSFFVFFSLFLSFFGFFVSLILCFFVSLILCFFVSLFVCFFVRWCLLCWLLACLLLCLFTRKESRGATYD